jgi:hypothetical protein
MRVARSTSDTGQFALCPPVAQTARVFDSRPPFPGGLTERNSLESAITDAVVVGRQGLESV